MVIASPGLLAAQDTVAATPRARLGVLPVLGSAPETGIQYGATVFRVYRTGPDSSVRPSVDQVSASNTGKGQLKASIQTERWMNANALRLRARIEYTDYPLPFFGVGPATSTDAEEWYRSTGPGIHVQLMRRLRPGTYGLVGYRFTRTTLSDLSDSGVLVQRTLVGSDGGTISQLQGGVIYDTRDNIFSARRGTLAQAVVSVAASQLGADSDFSRADIDVRQYLPVGRFVIASQLQYGASTGSTPFDQLPAIGADSAIRGYTRGRFRDRHLLSWQFELRTPHWHRFGIVAFAGSGVVAPHAKDLTGGTWQPSVGGGIRYVLFARDGNAIRVDFGKGRGASGLYIGLNEAF